MRVAPRIALLGLAALLAPLLVASCATAEPRRAPADAAVAATSKAPTSREEAIRRLEAPRTTEGPALVAPEGSDGSDSQPDLGPLTLVELMRATGVPGLSIAYFEGFELRWTATWGVSDVESGAAVTPETLFQAASISKPVTAAGVMAAVERGLIDLDRPVNEQLASWRLPENELTRERPVTPRMLLSHTGGTTVHGFPGYEPDAILPAVPDILDGTGGANTAAVRVDLAPFTRDRYSGGGTTIVQLLLGDVTKRPFAEVLDEWVLRPAGMSDSVFAQPLDAARSRRAARAHPAGVAGSVRWHVYPELAAAGLWTTPRDLARFAIEVQRALRGETDRGVSVQAAKALTTPVGVGTFAIGFQLQDRGSDEAGPAWYFGHSGGNWGFLCNLVAHLDEGYGYAVMINGGRFQAIAEIQRRIAEIYGWQGDFSRPPRNWPEAD